MIFVCAVATLIGAHPGKDFSGSETAWAVTSPSGTPSPTRSPSPPPTKSPTPAPTPKPTPPDTVCGALCGNDPSGCGCCMCKNGGVVSDPAPAACCGQGTACSNAGFCGGSGPTQGCTFGENREVPTSGGMCEAQVCVNGQWQGMGEPFPCVPQSCGPLPGDPAGTTYPGGSQVVDNNQQGSCTSYYCSNGSWSSTNPYPCSPDSTPVPSPSPTR